MSISNQVDFFLNFQQFGDLRLAARDGSDDAVRTVAQQFEGLFVQQMLAAMRSASKIDTGQHSSYMDFYQDMYDKQLSQTIAKQDRLGVAKMIMQQIPESEPAAAEKIAALNIPPIKPEAVTKTAVQESSNIKPAATPAAVETSASEHTVVSDEKAAVVVSKVVADDFAELAQIERANSRWQSPESFIADIWPQAQSAAQKLGVSAKLLLAQSALETGWGKHTMKFADGRSSYNLFGIKADPDWQGNSLNKTSLEYHDGILKRQESSFRAYASPAQSLADYADFIQTSSRYQQALQHAGDDRAYIREIHNAGYATDPHYADKVIGILNGELLQRSLASLDSGVTDHA